MAVSDAQDNSKLGSDDRPAGPAWLKELAQGIKTPAGAVCAGLAFGCAVTLTLLGNSAWNAISFLLLCLAGLFDKRIALLKATLLGTVFLISLVMTLRLILLRQDMEFIGGICNLALVWAGMAALLRFKSSSL